MRLEVEGHMYSVSMDLWDKEYALGERGLLRNEKGQRGRRWGWGGIRVKVGFGAEGWDGLAGWGFGFISNGI
jgi:hypothetical protein